MLRTTALKAGVPAANEAVTARGALIVRFWGVFVPERASAKPRKVADGLGVAVTERTVPAFTQLEAGVRLPGPETLPVNWCWVVKLAV